MEKVQMLDIVYTQSFRRSLKTGGVWLNFTGHRHGTFLKYFQISRVIYLLFIHGLILYKLFTSGMAILLTRSAAFIPLGSTLISMTVSFMNHSKNLERLADYFESNFSTYTSDWEKEIIKNSCDKLDKSSELMRKSSILFAVLYVFVPWAIEGVMVSLGYENSISLPLPLEFYIMEDERSRNFFFYSVIIASDIWILLAMTAAATNNTMLLFPITYISAEIEILRTSLKQLHAQVKEGNLINEIDQLPEWDLKVIVDVHRRIIRVTTNMNEAISFTYMIEVVTVGISLCLILFLIKQELHKNIVTVIMGATFFFILVGSLFVISFAGDSLQDENDRLLRTLYDIPWYRQSPTVRKRLLLIMTQAGRPHSLGYKQFSINLSSFEQMINTSYSYFTLLNSVSSS